MRSGQETTGGGDISPPAPARWAPHGAAGCKIRMGEIWDGRQDARPRGGGCRAWLEEGLARTGAAWAGRGGRGRLSPAGCLRPSSEHNRGDTQRRRRAVSPTSDHRGRHGRDALLGRAVHEGTRASRSATEADRLAGRRSAIASLRGATLGRGPRVCRNSPCVAATRRPAGAGAGTCLPRISHDYNSPI